MTGMKNKTKPCHPRIIFNKKGTSLHELVKEAADVIKNGGLVVFPTESFYGLAADTRRPFALKKVFRVKRREESKPLLVLIAEKNWINQLSAYVPPKAEKLMRSFWPGPLTIIFPAVDELDEALTGNAGKVGVRLPSHPVARALVRSVGAPITGTSANISGRPAPTTWEEAFKQIGDEVDCIIAQRSCCGGMGSTIIDVTHDPPRLLRRGLIAAKLIRECVGELKTE